MKALIFSLILLCSTLGFAAAQIQYPGEDPGPAIIKYKPENQVVIENKVIRMILDIKNDKIFVRSLKDKPATEEILVHVPLFSIELQDGSRTTSDNFLLKNKPVISSLTADPKASTYACRQVGKRVEADFENHVLGLSVHWKADLRDGANYIRQIFSFSAKDSIKISRIDLIQIPEKFSVNVVGTVDGSPLVHNSMFFALEHPMSQTEQINAYSVIYLPRLAPVTSSVSFTTSAVWGISPINQFRRGFLYYLEMERAYPYHQVLHYNSWYDLSWEDRTLNDSLCLDRIKVFNDSLITKRDIQLDAFLFDDGWDDYKTLWQFNSGFPEGFNNLKKACERSNAGIGVWVSPWGGYDIRKPQRIEYGKKQIPPFETNENGFTLSGPVYYKRFKEVTGNFITKYGVSLFKFDGVGAGNGANGASITYQKDIEAFLRLIGELRSLKSDLYLSLTIGTWPSVYFLKYGDAIWRAGNDTGIRGKGSRRQQWMNYRDAETYKNVVMRAPLYPLNSLMYHGICIGNTGIPGTLEMNDKDISDEIWSFFGSGTSLQEMYINPHKLNTANWDCLAKAISWSRENENAMVDVHWIGGDPAQEQVYGYAAWTPQKAYISLRNPSDVTKTFDVDVAVVFELPDKATTDYMFYDARTGERNQPLAQGRSFRVVLEPFEVKVLDAVPAQIIH